MTREEAKDSFYCIEAGCDGVALVDELYDDFEQQLADYKKRIDEYEHMIDWMESNSNSSLHDYYNREEG